MSIIQELSPLQVAEAPGAARILRIDVREPAEYACHTASPVSGAMYRDSQDSASWRAWFIVSIGNLDKQRARRYLEKVRELGRAGR